MQRGNSVDTTPGAPLLAEIAELLGREVELDALLARMLDTVARSLAAERATLFLKDPASGALLSRAGHLPELDSIVLRKGQGVAGHVAETGQVVNLPCPNADPRWYQGIDARTGFETRTLLAVPVRLGAERAVAGVLQALNRREGTFDGGDERLLVALAGQLAAALACTSLGPQLLARGSTVRAPALRYKFNRIVGDSAPMREVYTRVQRAAATEATVLITGESGTGKELFARAIHFNGARRDRPFVKVDCAALPATLVENELFGHARGAYTGAGQSRSGRFSIADTGTLFLDEIGELPLAVQGKLLRFLQDREFEPVGSHETRRVDVRVLSATNRDLPALIAAGDFRQDLYYRIKVMELRLPPLRLRGREDLARLSAHFIDIYNRKHSCAVSGLDERAWEKLCAHPWPGNVRELEHCLESAVVLAGEGPIRSSGLGLPRGADAPPSSAGPDLRPLAVVEREHILGVLEAVGGNQSEAARILEIGRNTLGRKLRAWRK